MITKSSVHNYTARAFRFCVFFRPVVRVILYLQTTLNRKICEGKLVAKLQDLNGPDSVDVYIRLDVFVYPLGLVPGAQVTFYNVERKMSKTQSIYCAMNDDSALALHSWDKHKLCDTNNRSAAFDLFDTTYEYNT